MSRERGGPLQGYRIIDCSSVVAGPWATHVLAEYGADVVKVEPPEGDIMRYAPPARHRTMGSEFLQMNRSKRSVVLDLKTTDGRDALLGLCAGADVFLTNVRPAAMARLALAYADVAAANPAIVYASIVGFDQRGPLAARPAYDDLIQGASGLASLFVASGGDEPRYVASLLADRIAGITAVHAILAALLYRERTGAGTALEIPMFETMVELVLADHLGGHVFEPPAGPFGYGRILSPHRRPYRTADGYVCVLLYNDAHWERFFAIAGRAAQYAQDPRLHDGAQRRANYDDAYEIVAGILTTRSSAAWLEVLEAHDIPALPLHDIATLLEDPQLVATGFLATAEHPTEGTIRTMRMPVRFSGPPPVTATPAPNLDEHSLELLGGA